MKRYQIINFHHLLSRIDLQKVDKESRTTLIDLDIVLGDIVDAHNDDVEKIKTRLSKGHEEEVREVSALYAELESAENKQLIMDMIASHTAYIEIQEQLNNEVNKRLMEDICVKIEKISSVDLAQWCSDSGISITLDQLRNYRQAGLIF